MGSIKHFKGNLCFSMKYHTISIVENTKPLMVNVMKCMGHVWLYERYHGFNIKCQGLYWNGQGLY